MPLPTSRASFCAELNPRAGSLAQGRLHASVILYRGGTWKEALTASRQKTVPCWTWVWRAPWPPPCNRLCGVPPAWGTFLVAPFLSLNIVGFLRLGFPLKHNNNKDLFY